MKNLLKWGATALLGASALGLSACASGGPTDITNRRLVSIPIGTVTNPDIRIVASDGSFELRGGQQFNSPFQMDLWTRPVTALSDANIINGYNAARSLGAKDVRVYVAGRAQPLYGVLALSGVYGAATGPGARSYQINIPRDKIDNAYGGNTSVVYEDVAWQQTWSNGTRNNYHFRSWVLWLSATPL